MWQPEGGALLWDVDLGVGKLHPSDQLFECQVSLVEDTLAILSPSGLHLLLPHTGKWVFEAVQ